MSEQMVLLIEYPFAGMSEYVGMDITESEFNELTEEEQTELCHEVLFERVGYSAITKSAALEFTDESQIW